MIDRFTYKNGKKMRYGYTTGSCATAASKASAEILLSNRKIEFVEIDTPKGWNLKLSIEDITVKSDYVITAIKKDSGDDPDVTNGILIYSKVKYIKSGIEITGGIGVGVVTKKGLKVEVGNPAINPVPLEMIKKEVKKVMEKYNYKNGLSIEISIPEGEEKAKRTFNPRLGIKGGLSVIGTTGIVEPMSDDAFKDSLAIELKMIKSNKLVLVPGNYGRDYCLDQNIEKSLILKTSNFIGFMFEQVCVYDIEKVLFVGHIGKLIKVAGGIFHTHNRVADARLDILVSHLVRVDATNEQLRNILNMNTTEEAVEYIYSEKLEKVFDLIVESIKFRIQNYIFDQYQVEVILFSSKRGKLSETKNANEFLELLHE